MLDYAGQSNTGAPAIILNRLKPFLQRQATDNLLDALSDKRLLDEGIAPTGYQLPPGFETWPQEKQAQYFLNKASELEKKIEEMKKSAGSGTK